VRGALMSASVVSTLKVTYGIWELLTLFTVLVLSE
jgi:hypothetical protein